ncbi:hypothetical protein D3C81_1215360 [compost metagenome]
MRHDAVRGRGPFVETQAVAGAGADGHQQVHVAGAGAHGFPRSDIKTRTENELHRGGQDKLRPGRQHPVDAKGLQQHRQHQRQGQQHRQGHRPALLAQAAFGIGLVDFGTLRQACRVAGMTDGIDQHAAVDLAKQLQVRAFVGQVDGYLLHARNLGQGAFDAPGAGGAGHAADLQLEGLGWHAVAGLLNGFDQRWQAVGRGLDPGLFGGQVDTDLFGTNDLAQGALDPASTAGAGHAGNRQVERGRCGHGALLLGQASSINLAMRGRSIAQAGPDQLEAILIHGNAVFIDLAGPQCQLLAALVLQAVLAARHLCRQQAQTHRDLARRQVERGRLLLKQPRRKLVIQVHADLARGRHFQALARNGQYAVIGIALGAGLGDQAQYSQQAE